MGFRNSKWATSSLILVSASIAFPGSARAALTLSPERATADRTSGPVPAGGRALGLATGPETRLAVWSDRRGLVASRLDASGNGLDAGGLLLASAGEGPVVGWNGADFVVAWRGAAGVFVSRVSPQGAVRDAVPIPGAQPPNPSYLAFSADVDCDTDSGQCLIAWEDLRGGDSAARMRVFATRVTREGSVLDPGGFEISGDLGRRHPRVAFGAGAYAVTFHATGRQARARRVAADGSLLDVAEVPLGPGYDARVAFDGARFTCIFSDDGTAAGQGRLFGVRLPREGAPIDASPRLLVSGIKPSYEVYDSSYDVGGDASGAVVVFVDSADSVLSFHLDRELAATAASPLRESGWAYQTPVLVAGARSALPALGAWLLDWPMPTVVGAALDVDGRPTAPLATVSVGVATQRSPAVARGPQGYLLAWIERRAALAADVRALRLDAEGAPLEVGSRWLATVTGEAYDVHAASDGQDFLVAFAARDVESAQSSLRAIRVRGDGVPLDPLPVPVMESLERGDGRDVDEVSVAFGGGSYLLAAGIRQASSRRIGMARLGRDGSLLGGPGPILLGEEGANRPRLDFDGARFGIAYIQPTTTGVYEEHARFRFVRPDGVVGEPIALPFPGYRDSGGVRIDDVTLTWDGARHVLATFNPAREVLALRVSAAGELLDPEPARLLGTDPVPANQYLFYPTLAAGAEGVLFVYKTLDPTAVLARLLSPALAPVGGASEIGVTAVRTVGDAPSIVLGPGGRALLVYAHGAAGDEGGSERLRWRVGVADFTTVPAAPDAGMDAPPDAAPPADAGMDAAADAAPPADAGMDAVADAGVVADSGGGDAAGSPETGADRDRSTDAGGDGGAVASAPGAPKSGCSCAIVRRADGGGWLLAPLALAVVLACGRRRGARRTA